MTFPVGDFDMTEVTQVLLADGWHDIEPGTLNAVQDPVFLSGGGRISGGLWAGFTGTDGLVYAFPVSPFIAVRYAPAGSQIAGDVQMSGEGNTAGP